MNFTKYYSIEFISRESGAPIYTSRAEWESAPCIIDMTQVTDAEMQQFVDKFYIDNEGDINFEEAEAWLITNTKAKYVEDYTEIEKEEYHKRSQKLYYKK